MDYDDLAKIPNKIRDHAEHHFKSNIEKFADALRDALVIQWMTVFPWRRKNLIGCKLGKAQNGANLFKGEIPA